MKLEVGMYIRTKDGIIAKVDYIDNDTIFFDKELYRTYGDSIDFLEKDNLERIVKASYNIIDILEAVDFVSTIIGECAVIAGVYNDINSKKYLRLCNCIGEYYEDDIKSIVTKEQIKQISYKVVSKDERDN